MWHYSVDGRKGQSTLKNVVAWIQKGHLGPDTLVWTEGMDKWLPLKETELAQYLPASPQKGTSSNPKMAPSAPPKQLFCTHCGNSISEQAVACLSCGAKPTGHKKFCRQCGVAVNPEQIVCTQCGAAIKTGYAQTVDNMSAMIKSGLDHVSSTKVKSGMDYVSSTKTAGFFDLGFTRFITNTWISVIWVFEIAIVFLYYIIAVLYASYVTFSIPPVQMSFPGKIVLVLFAVCAATLVAIFALAAIRVALEFLIVIFRIETHLRTIRDKMDTPMD